MPKARSSGTDSKNYKIGKGRPPAGTQWKPGQSGNPKGRRKGAKNFATLFHQEMNRKVTISENGQRRLITKLEAMIKQVINSAARGDPKAIQAMINIERQIGGLTLPDHLKEPIRRRRFTLSVFEKDPITGEHFQMVPGSTKRVEDAADM
jgi:hypothetical protein